MLRGELEDRIQKSEEKYSLCYILHSAFCILPVHKDISQSLRGAISFFCLAKA